MHNLNYNRSITGLVMYYYNFRPITPTIGGQKKKVDGAYSDHILVKAAWSSEDKWPESTTFGR